MDHRLTDPQIMGLLEERHREGVSVEIMPIAPVSGLLSHGRIILIDDGTAIIGSMHLSSVSLDSRREVAIVVDDPSVTAEVQGFFESLMRQPASADVPPAVLVEDEDDEED